MISYLMTLILNMNGKSDQMMIAGSRDIDLVLGGHSHTYFKTLRYVKNLDGKDIPVDQNGKKCQLANGFRFYSK